MATGDDLIRWKVIIFPWEEVTFIENKTVLDYHSVLNVLNIIVMQFELLNMELDPPGNCQNIMDQIDEISTQIHGSSEAAQDGIRACVPLNNDLIAFSEILRRSKNPELSGSTQLLVETAERLNTCVQELLERIQNPDLWTQPTAAEIEQQIKAFFALVAKNSRGKYDFTYDGTEKSPNTYRMNLKFDTGSKGYFDVPPVLLDTLRDLAANARKYTKPGGEITITLCNTDESIQLEVEDTGIGIPREEIMKVVDFGFRASNVDGIPTMGGGFGLTKALSVASRYHGQMTIASALDKGTKISITIPRRKSS